MRTLLRLSLAIASVQAFGLAANVAEAAPRYRLVDLGALGAFDGGQYDQSFGVSINESGQVAGYNLAGGTVSRGFYTVGASMLGVPGNGSYANSLADINELGLSAGSHHVQDNQFIHGFTYDGTTTTDIGSPNVTNDAQGLNNLGDVTGNSSLGPGGSIAYVLHDGVVSNLSSVGTGRYTQAYKINDAGQVIGRAGINPQDTYHAIIWQGAGYTDLGTLGGSLSWGFDINSLGHATGMASTAGEAQHAFLWRDGAMIDLGPALSAGGGSGLNDLDQVVGIGAGVSTLWSGGQMYDLQTLLVNPEAGVLMDVRDINNRGQIVGTALVDPATGFRHAVRLDPVGVPEPATWSLMILGFGAAGARVRNRRTARI